MLVACSGVSQGRAKNALLGSHYFNCCHCGHGNLWRPGLWRDLKKILDTQMVTACVYFHQIYLPCVLQTKKRYVGYMYESLDQKEPVFDAKGIETVRRDSCPAVSKVPSKPSLLSHLRRVLHQAQRQDTIHTNKKSCTASEHNRSYKESTVITQMNKTGKARKIYLIESLHFVIDRTFSSAIPFSTDFGAFH